MKPLVLFAILPAMALAQPPSLSTNLQAHWDFHREVFTSTVEFFEMDKYGTTFFFTDFDYGSTGQQSSYFEIARNIAVYRMKPVCWNATVQFNDGVLPTDAGMGKGIPRTILYGVAVSDITWGSAMFELQALVRQEYAVDAGWQLTAVWSWTIPRTPLEFLGYVDWNSNETNKQPTSVQAEPQLQLRWGEWAIGSEVEISRNFPGAYTKKQGYANRTWYTHPTAYIRVYF